MTGWLPVHGRREGKRQQLVGYALVDEWLVPWLAQWRWNFINGYIGRFETVVPGRGGYRRCIYLHRVLAGVPDGLEADHINRNPRDNRLCNLRIVTDAENKHNVPARGGSSEYRGVTWDKERQRWTARVRSGNKGHFIGRFLDEQEAAEAARKARESLLPLAEGVY